MKTLLKLSVTAAFLLSSSAAFSVTPDSETLDINLNGQVDSRCELIPEGSVSYTVDMADINTQGFAAIAYSCNSPYTLTIVSANGGMKHQESNSINIDYDLYTFGFGGADDGFKSFTASQITSAAIVDQENSWQNILLNGGITAGTMDLQFAGLSEYQVAGTYKDTLTLTLSADL